VGIVRERKPLALLGRVRPLAGLLLAVAGAVALFLGWYGVSGTPVPAKQLPYLVSGGLTGVGLLVLAAAAFAADDVRRQLGDVRATAEKVDQLYQLLTEPAIDEPVGELVVVERGTTFHRGGCRLVSGKRWHQASEQELTGLRPCRVCAPSPTA
jgi:hypothetical protein